MKSLFKSFAKADGGAITVEFIVLCAAVVGLGIIGYAGLGSGTQEVVNVDPDASLERFVAGF